jgi:hypothetical protein
VVNSYGAPDTSIVFYNPPFPTGRVEVTQGGISFRFNSIDLYSSITPIPYAFTGLLNGNTAFTTSGTVQNTFGNFANVPNPHGTDVINTLQVMLSNPHGPNPVGLDNIVVNASATGNPHFTTYGGVHYDYQGIGDFVLARSIVDEFEVQVRTRSLYDDAAVTIMSQAAATLCNHKVAFDIDHASAGNFVWLDGSPVSLSTGSPVPIGDGCEVLQNSPNNYRLIWNTGEMLDVTNQGTYLDLASQLSSLDLLGSMEGLLSSELDPDHWRVIGTASLFTPVPEPSTLTLLSLGIGFTALCVKRRRLISSQNRWVG